MKAYCILNKKFDRLLNKNVERLLKLQPESEIHSDWGFDGHDSRIMDFNKSILELYDSEFGGTIFVSTDLDTVNNLVKNGVNKYPDEIRISDFERLKRFGDLDLEVVEVELPGRFVEEEDEKDE